MAMQISSYYSFLLDSNRNIFHRLKTAFRKVSSVTSITGFIKSLAGDQISPRPVILPNQLEEKMWLYQGRNFSTFRKILLLLP